MKITILLIIALVTTSTVSFSQDVLKATSGSIITVQSGAVFYVSGGISLDNNSTFNNAGIVTINRTAVVSADLTDNTVTPYTYGVGKFVFTGTGTQSIKSVNQFEQIDVGDAGLNFLSNIHASTWYLKTGKVNTGVFIAIATSTAGTAVQADATNANFANSWINGNLRRFITPATVDNYTFPVGDATKVNMAEMDNLIANPLTGVTYITVSFGPKPGNDVGLNVTENGTAYSSVNTGGVWYVVPDANPGSGKYDMKLYFNGFTGLANNSFGILRRPDASSTAIDWIVPTGSVLPAAGSLGRMVAGGYARRNNMTTFSQLGIGVSLTPLPLQLLSFSAVKKDKTVLLQWTTSNENNTSHFELYRSGLPVVMQYLDKVAAAGYSNTDRSYGYTDVKPLQGVNYYQLKMLDKDNSYTLSQLVKINFDEITSIKVYPNPVINNSLFVDFSGVKVKAIKLIATDGKQVTCGFAEQSNNRLKVIIPSAISKGTYILQLNTDEGLRNTMIVIQ
jgi:hypothetical protein